MGHIRLGRLPKSRKWSQIVDLLSQSELKVDEIAKATMRAASDYLLGLKSETGLYFNYWLLTQLTWMSRSDKFYDELASIGFELKAQNSAMGFITQIAVQSNNALRDRPSKGIFSDIAQQSMREVLTRILSEKSESLFGSTSDDIRLALRENTNQKQFGKVSRVFFSTFLNRYLQFFISKEISNFIGHNTALKSIDDVAEFDKALHEFCFQSARIIEDFAGGWYSKKNWQGDITEKDAKKFVSVALKKISSDLALEVTAR